MKLKYEFEILDMAGDICAVPVGEHSEELHAVLQLNETGALILRLLRECGTFAEILEKLCAEYPEDDKKQMEQALSEFLQLLTGEGLLIP